MNKTLAFFLVLGGALTALPACVSSRVVLNPAWDRSHKPDYVDYFDYYFLGLKGEASVDLQKVCMDQKPWAAEHVRTIEDGLITASTLGIYAPMTVKVWCGN